MDLVFGVIDQTYPKGNSTTGAVAGYLEKRYGVIGHFIEDNHAEVADIVVQIVKQSVKEIMTGEKAVVDLDFKPVQNKFKEYILGRSLDGKVEGVPTKSAEGKGYYGKKGPHPSFYVSGLYASSFTAWIE
jgi:hypothetical protein